MLLTCSIDNWRPYCPGHITWARTVLHISWSTVPEPSSLALDVGSPGPASLWYLPLAGSWAWTRRGWAWTTVLGLGLLPPSLSFQALHLNWCQQVKFIPQLNLVASCSAIDKSSLVLTVLPSKVPDSLK